MATDAGAYMCMNVALAPAGHSLRSQSDIPFTKVYGSPTLAARTVILSLTHHRHNLRDRLSGT